MKKKEMKNKTRRGRKVACLFYGVTLKCLLTIESEMCSCESLMVGVWGGGGGAGVGCAVFERTN